MSRLTLSNLSDLLFFFFNDTATTEIYTLSLHDALPISPQIQRMRAEDLLAAVFPSALACRENRSEEHRLNSSHSQISYAVFCLKKKKKTSTSTSARPKQTHTSRRLRARVPESRTCPGDL